MINRIQNTNCIRNCHEQRTATDIIGYLSEYILWTIDSYGLRLILPSLNKVRTKYKMVYIYVQL